MWNNFCKFFDKWFGKIVELLENFKDKLDKDPLGRHKKLFLALLGWYLFGLLTFGSHPTMFLFIGMSVYIYDMVFNKPKK